ncbi:MAG: ftsI [Gammaproteobacteria bacterium]|jgi:cell division protein FtsI (penicillin-binding protein 3)|nr:ftsI [Gammaproteobacteria bacterium]
MTFVRRRSQQSLKPKREEYRKQKHRSDVITWRYRFIFIVLLFLSAALIWRLVYLTLIDQSFLRNQGDARTLRIFSMPAYRGIITDRNGEPLAVSTPVQSVWITPKTFEPTAAQLQQLSQLLSMPLSVLKKHIPAQDTSVEFVYLKRQIEPAIADRIEQLAIPGLHFQQEFRRYYPEGEVTAQLIGFTNIDDEGQEGMELAYDAWLRGEPGKKRVIVDRMGRAVSNIRVLKEAQPGHNLTLSIDKRLQYLAYRELKKAVLDNKATAGSVVILQPQTGEVLAMVNYPSFNPNQRIRKKDDTHRNRAVTDMFEPGSTAKTFSVVSALMSGKYEPTTIVDVSPGWMKVDHNIVRDEHNLGQIDVKTILKRSSNVGIAKLTLSLPPERLPDLFYKIGFGSRTNSGFPGESTGTIQNLKPRQHFSLATLAFGYGLSVTDLQLAQAYAILAEDGVKYPVSLLKVKHPPPGAPVLPKKVAQETVDMLESVVETGGTAPKAQVKGYRVAGKTGTARMLGPKGYQSDHHIAFFVGIAPVSQPEFVVSVVITDPKGREYLGGDVAAPVFSRILGGALRVLAISPDRDRV